VVIFLSGSVSADAGSGMKPVDIGASLPGSSTISVGEDSSCELQFGRTAVVHIEANTLVVLNELSLEQGNSRTVLGLDAGVLVCKVNALSADSRFKVRTHSAICGVRGTEFVVSATTDQATVLAVKKGAVSILPSTQAMQNVRDRLVDNLAPIAAALDRMEETAPVVYETQQVTVTTDTAARTRQAYAALSSRLADLLERKQKGEQAAQADVERSVTTVEQSAPAVDRLIEQPKVISTENAKTLERTDIMRIVNLPAVSAPVQAPAQPTAPSIPEPQSVTVIVQTAPSDADIYFNGFLMGKGEFSGVFNPGDALTFLATREGYEDKSLQVTVGREKTSTYRIQLVPKKPATENIGVSAVPSDAEILLDGRSVGKGNFTESFDLGGSHVITVRRDGYFDTTLELSITAGSGKVYRVILDPKPIETRFSVSSKPIIGRVIVLEGKVYAADAEGTLTAATTRGKVLWTLATKNAPNETAFPQLLGTALCFSGPSELVIAEAATGKVISRQGLDSASAHVFGQHVMELNGMAVFPTSTGLRLLSLSDGSVVKEITVAEGSMMSPAVWNGRILTVNQVGTLFALDPGTDAVSFQVPTKTVQPVAVSVQVYAGRGFFADRKGLVACVDLGARTELWEKPLVAKGSAGVFQDLECGREGVFAFAKNTIYALSADAGNQMYAPITDASCPPLLLNGLLYYGTGKGMLIVADAATGKTLKTLDVGGHINGRPRWADERLIAGTTEGEILVLNPDGIK
jgi:outer membrane protein assembly factor BamB